MSYKFAFAVLAALAIAFSGTVHAAAPAPVMINKQLTKDCINSPLGRVVDPRPDTSIPHQYMLLLVFKKDQGAKYFGNAQPSEYGCIPNVPNGLVVAEPTQLRTENCPNDCVYPFGERPPTDNGNDPLNVLPARTNKWGVLSAVDSKTLDGGAKRRIEIWQIAVVDACHARSLYALHTKELGSLFNRAYDSGDMLGEVMVGYPVAGNGNAASHPCSKL